jgi:hypothetical protein
MIGNEDQRIVASDEVMFEAERCLTVFFGIAR